jgi:hypothetical protein
MWCLSQRHFLFEFLIFTHNFLWVCGRSPAEIVGSNPTGGTGVCCECCVLSGRGLCDELITRPEESCRLWCVVVCDLEISSIRSLRHTGGCRAKNKQTRSLLAYELTQHLHHISSIRIIFPYFVIEILYMCGWVFCCGICIILYIFIPSCLFKFLGASFPLRNIFNPFLPHLSLNKWVLCSLLFQLCSINYIWVL